jgi:hypothetical protein
MHILEARRRNLVWLDKICLNERHNKVRTDKHLSNFSYQNGLKQGDALTSLLFNML